MNNYFSHDSNARNSEKLLQVRMKYGAAGYGVYFMILERLRDETDYMSIKDYNMIAFDLRVDASMIKAVVEDFGLFVFTDDGKYFYSEGFKKRMAIKDQKSKKRAKAGKKGANVRWQTHSNAIAKPMANDSKESKVKKRKDNNKTLRSKRAEPVYEHDNDYYKLADYMLKRIRDNKPDYKEPNLQKWADVFRKIIEIDKRDKHETALLIKWVQQDSFEQTNVLSPDKLRKRYDQLVMKMNKNKGSQTLESPVDPKKQAQIDAMHQEFQNKLRNPSEPPGLINQGGQ